MELFKFRAGSAPLDPKLSRKAAAIVSKISAG